MSTATELITIFETQVNDVTELSTSEELSLMNRVYQRVCNSRPWEFLKTPLTGTMSGSGVDGYYITQPADFGYFYENNEWTDNTISNGATSAPIVIYVGASKSPYKVINYSDRYKYLGSTGYAYLDLANSKIYFTGTPVSTTYYMDYIKVPATLVGASTPVIPTRFQDILVFGMATENDIIQLSPKAKSYAPENLSLYEQYLDDMALWNSRLILN
jgi:hypothetical protein